MRDGRPDGFGKGDLTREGTVLHQLRGVEVFGPEVGLCALDMVALVGGNSLRDGVVVVDLLQRSIAADSHRLDLGVSLIMVDIEASTTWGHDHVMTHIGRLDTTIFATPAHDGSRGGKTALEDLIPSDELLSMGSEHLLGTTDHIALELMFVLEPFILDTLLAVRAFLPAILGAFVPTDVEVFTGEERDYLVEYILDELEGRFLTSAVDIILDAPDITHAVLTAIREAGELWV